MRHCDSAMAVGSPARKGSLVSPRGGPRRSPFPPAQKGSPHLTDGVVERGAPSPCAEGESTAVTTVPAKRHGGPGGAPHRMVHTRTLIYATCAAHKGLIPPLCAALCFLIPSLVCATWGGAGRCARSEAASAAGADGYWCRWALSAPRAEVCCYADASCWHERALSAPTRVVDTDARYIPLAVPTTPSQCRQPPHGANNPLAVSSTTPHNVDDPLTVSTTRARIRTTAVPLRPSRPLSSGLRTQGPRFTQHAPHTRAGSSPCVRRRVA